MESNFTARGRSYTASPWIEFTVLTVCSAICWSIIAGFANYFDFAEPLLNGLKYIVLAVIAFGSAYLIGWLMHTRMLDLPYRIYGFAFIIASTVMFALGGIQPTPLYATLGFFVLSLFGLWFATFVPVPESPKEEMDL